MTRGRIAFYTLVLVIMGAGWGITQPLTKIAVSTGYKHFGLVFWQLVIGAIFMAVVCGLRGIRLPMEPRHLRFYLMIAMLGTIIPNSASYQAAVHLPAGILSILISMVPMWAFPIALAMGLDRFSLHRFAGLAFGLLGVLLLVAPGLSANLDIPVLWVCVSLIAGFCYATEGNVVAKWGTQGLDPLQVLFGASLVGAVLALPLMLFSGQWIAPTAALTLEGQAHVAGSIVHVVVYSCYVWLLGRAGPVFTVQVGYLVTGFGVLWAKLLLGEAYSPAIWASLVLMFIGMYLVQPRSQPALAKPAPISDTVR